MKAICKLASNERKTSCTLVGKYLMYMKIVRIVPQNALILKTVILSEHGPSCAVYLQVNFPHFWTRSGFLFRKVWGNWKIRTL